MLLLSCEYLVISFKLNYLRDSWMVWMEETPREFGVSRRRKESHFYKDWVDEYREYTIIIE